MREWWILALAPAALAAQEDDIEACAISEADLEHAVAEATKILEANEPEDSNILFQYTFSSEYGESCGFWFTQAIAPDSPGELIAGPIEVILAKAEWRHVETKYYSHEVPPR